MISYCIDVKKKIPGGEERGTVLRLHSALTESQCNRCGKKLKWRPDFNDVNGPKYVANHCNQDFVITIDRVKVEVAKSRVKVEVAKSRKGKIEETIIDITSSGSQPRAGRIVHSGKEAYEQTTGSTKQNNKEQKPLKELILPNDSNEIKG
jgi:NAD-dependent SIR2 family protein deacetylase